MKLVTKPPRTMTLEMSTEDFVALFKLLGVTSYNEFKLKVGQDYPVQPLYEKMFKIVVELGLRRGIDY